MAKFANGLVLVRTRALRPAASAALGESAGELLPAALRALSAPGLPRSSVFTGAPNVHAYSINPEDPARLVQESEDGTQVTGTVVEGRFEPVAPIKPTR